MRNPTSKYLASPLLPFVIGLLIMSACTVSESDSNKNDARTTAAQNSQPVSAMPSVDVTTNFAEEDTVPAMDTVTGTMTGTAAVTDTAAALASITPQKTAAIPASFPQTPPKAGPATLQLQILLDRSNFSPGVLTGVWDDNARHALTWFRVARGMDSTATVDGATYDQLKSSAGNSPLVTQYTLTDADAKGPFVTIPSNVYQKAKLNCLCYQSVGEEMSERFHSSPALLRRLNPNVDLKTLKAGSTLWVPNVARDTAAPPPFTTARIVISKTDFWTHAIDSSGKVVAHYPSTLGNSYDPSPTGDFSVASITKMPAFHYQPTLFHEVPDSKPEAHLPKGPNSPVGVVWMALSKEHYGIHGTENPATIGVTQSHGCVRLTNWDASTLSGTVRPGVPVTFQ
ncbi:MAG: L,D-transpeptidase [Gemmatimonadaceae bacterium]